MIISLFLFFTIQFSFYLQSLHGRVHYITSSNIHRSCHDICGHSGLGCNNQQSREMDCQYIASEICSMSVSNDNNNYFPCTYGGCFVNCNYALYANKEPQYSTCSSETDCSNSHGMPQFARICACESSDSVALSVWQIIGISTGVFFFFSILCALIMYFYLEYSLKQEYGRVDDSEHGRKGEKDSKENDGNDEKTWSDRYDGCKEACYSCWIPFTAMVTAACVACWLFCRGNSDQEKGSSSPEQTSRRKRGDPEKKEKKSWLKLKYGKKDKKKAAAPEQGSWYKEGGLPSTYDQPATKEKKTKYSYGDDDIESDLTSDEERRQRRFGEKDRVLSTYAEYQESSSDFGKGKRGERKGPTTTNPTHATPTPVAAPPPLLSQRRASLPPSSSPIEATPTYQPKPVQAPPLLSQRSSKDSQSSSMQSDRDVSDSKSQRSSRSRQSEASAPIAVWQAGPGKIVKVSRREQGYNWDAESQQDSSVVSDSSFSDLSHATSVQQSSKGRRIRGGNV